VHLRETEPGSSSGFVVPVDDTQSPERIPSARLVVTLLELKMHLAGICILQQPSTIRLLLGSQQMDRFVYTRVRRIPDRAEVFEGAQYVVMPPGGK